MVVVNLSREAVRVFHINLTCFMMNAKLYTQNLKYSVNSPTEPVYFMVYLTLDGCCSTRLCPRRHTRSIYTQCLSFYRSHVPSYIHSFGFFLLVDDCSLSSHTQPCASRFFLCWFGQLLLLLFSLVKILNFKARNANDVHVLPLIVSENDGGVIEERIQGSNKWQCVAHKIIYHIEIFTLQPDIYTPRMAPSIQAWACCI